ncbi:hypothetical protein COV13_03370 [Candidatus Woesearchaeota archaeon CG10_big_fil_rev_8_21_14_0_10_32_9]|nr:MAG: hypothetical protein COV13_03370 [Candidatus Woesearchaeota archaeon CG10_big_fil_rev_8_21_14_0_10_32_9]
MMHKIYHSTGINEFLGILNDGAVLSYVDKLSRDYSKHANISINESREFLISKVKREERDLNAFFSNNMRDTIEGKVEKYKQKGELVVMEFDVNFKPEANTIGRSSLSLDHLKKVYAQNPEFVKTLLVSFKDKYSGVQVFKY